MLWVYLRLCQCVCVKPKYMEWTLADTPGTACHMGMCEYVRVGVCFCGNNWEARAVPPTNRIRTIVPLTVFVVVWRQEMRSCWGLWLCVHGAYRRKGLGQEENTNSLLGGLAELWKLTDQSKEDGNCGYTRHCCPSCFLSNSWITPFMLQHIVKQVIPSYQGKLPFLHTLDTSYFKFIWI